MGRTPVASGRPVGDLSHSGERCRARVAEAVEALGGNRSAAASIIWHICGLEWPTSRWAITVGRRQEQACGILIGALGALTAHFAGRRTRAPGGT